MRLVGIVYLAALAVSVSLAAVAIGAVLSTALLIGPPATALRLTKSPGRAMVVSALTGLAATWLSIVAVLRLLLLAAARPRLAGAFFVVVLVLLGYLLSLPAAEAAPRPRAHRTRRPSAARRSAARRRMVRCHHV